MVFLSLMTSSGDPVFGDKDEDGLLERMFKFDRQDVQSLVEETAQELAITVSGFIRTVTHHNNLR